MQYQLFMDSDPIVAKYGQQLEITGATMRNSFTACGLDAIFREYTPDKKVGAVTF